MYTLQAFILDSPAAAVARANLALAVARPQGFTLFPLTSRLLDVHKIPFLPFDDSSCSSPLEVLTRLGTSLSRGGRVAYIEAMFAGGAGYQAGVCWEKGRVSFPPVVSPDAINPALRSIGVQSSGCVDEFRAIGLGENRHTDAWELRG